MDLPLLSALLIVLALSLYVLLDGLDLGVGALLLTQSDERLRNRMVDSIAPVWDGNETWLILAGITLFAGFPTAYAVLMPALYLPLVVMLFALGIRGVSFEFRHQSTKTRRRWDFAFAAGSVVGALSQGLIVGALVQGIAVEGTSFAGGPLDAFTPFTALTALVSLTGYVTQGAAWLCLKGEPSTRRLAQAWLRWTPAAFLAVSGISVAVAMRAQPGLLQRWHDHPIALSLLAVCGAACALSITWRAWHADFVRSSALLMVQAMFVCGLIALYVIVFPNVVPFRISLWNAASEAHSHAFLLIGALVAVPMVLAYNAFAYWVFRGTTPADGWDS